MKKSILLLFAFTVIGLLASAQDQALPIVAVFDGTRASLDKAIDSKTISFTLKNLDNESKEDFEKKAQTYINMFTLYYPSIQENKHSQLYTVTFKNNTGIKILKRLFFSANIQQIEFEGTTMSTEDFFLPYMNMH